MLILDTSALVRFFTKDITSQAEEVKKALEIYSRTKLDIADCIIVAASETNKLLSFDKELVKIAGGR